MIVRIPRRLYQTIREDLKRPHPFAAERVGFAYGRYGRGASAGLVLIHSYDWLPDDVYIEDRYVGAKVGSAPIRQAMQVALSNHLGVFHVHEHLWSGIPSFSPTDSASLAELVPSFRRLAQDQAHGALLFSPDAALARVWLPGGADPVDTSRVSVVGYPLTLLGVSRHG